MKRFLKPAPLLVFTLLLTYSFPLWSQPCTTPGQTPSTAFPVCGTTTFQQNTVPICSTNDLFVPGCSGTGGANYQNKNPFFYKFTCFVAGTLGFLITPNANDEDYDWQLYDITGKDPNEIFTNSSLIVSGNWSGSYGTTGAASGGVNFIQCASDPNDNKPRFASMPLLIKDHEYLLMISHFTNTQSGYALSFQGGTAVITDPAIPHMQTAKVDCEGLNITLKLNKKLKCNSLTAAGSEFSLSPSLVSVVSASTITCSPGFDFSEITIRLSSPLPSGNYQLIINNGTDGNTLKDNCDNVITSGEQVPFQYLAPQPVFADSIGRLSCAPDYVRIYFPKKIVCASIAPNGSDFSVTGPNPVTVVGATGNCVNGKTDYIDVKFANPIYTKGNYQLTLKAGTDGSTVIDECGQESPVQTLDFQAYDTVSADFQYNAFMGCRVDTLSFLHDGAHDVTAWYWKFNNTGPLAGPSHTLIFPATSTNVVSLVVHNGVCSDSTTRTIVLDNEVKVSFTMADIICPEDKLTVTNTSTGDVSTWNWSFDNIASSNLKDPPPVQFPTNNRETYYTIKLVGFNSSLGCRDSSRQKLTVLDHCFIDIPTAFTPNNDGLNDQFWPHNAIKADNFDFKVFNRWGQLVFHTKEWRRKWDGKLNGMLQATGVYVWILSYTNRDTGQPVFRKGHVTLIR